MLKKDLPASILYLSRSRLMIFSTSLTGSDPGDRIKNIGICGSESAITEPRMSKKEDLESMSIKSSPLGNTSRMNRDNATVIRSGLKHLKTNNFLNGVVSSFFHSRGSLTSYGVNSLYQSLKRVGASFSMFCAKLLNSSSVVRDCTRFHEVSGNQSSEFSTPGLGIAFIKKSIS